MKTRLLLLMVLLVSVVGLLVRSSVATAAEQVFDLTVGGTTTQLDDHRQATFTFVVGVHSPRQSTSSTGLICVLPSSWQWVTQPTVPQLANPQDQSRTTGTIRATGTDTWTGTRDAKFFVVMGNQCPTSEANAESNVVTKALSLPSTPPGGGTGGTSATDKVQVTSFTITPNEPFEGQKVTIEMKTKVLQKLDNFQWQIAVDDIGKMETKSNLNVGDTFTATLDWVAIPGDHRFTGMVDPNDQLQEVSSTNRANNKGGPITKNIAPLRTETLIYKRAKQAGATFDSHNSLLENPVPCDACTGVFDPSDPVVADCLDVPKKSSSVVLTVSCPGPFPPSFSLSPEAFKNFTLKNGWRIKSVEVPDELKRDGSWSMRIQPAPGSNSPYTRPTIRPYEPYQLRLLSYLMVRILIEGPANKSPYVEGAPHE